MTYFRKTLTISFALAFLALVAPLSVSAAYRANRGDQGANLYVSKYALNETARQLAYQSKIFQWQLERELNRSYLDGTLRERRANQLSVDFRGAAETLHSLYAAGRSVNNSTDEAGNLQRLGNDLDDFVSQARLSPATLESWDAMRCELSVLADVYATSAEDEQADTVSTPGAEFHSAASSQGRIWRWPF
jgi:hypothetical protein